MKNFLRLSHLLSSPRISDDFRQGKPDGLEIHSKFFPHSSRIPLLSVFSAEFRPECKVQTYQSAIWFFCMFQFFQSEVSQRSRHQQNSSRNNTAHKPSLLCLILSSCILIRYCKLFINTNHYHMIVRNLKNYLRCINIIFSLIQKGFQFQPIVLHTSIK